MSSAPQHSRLDLWYKQGEYKNDLRPDFMQNELARVPDFPSQLGAKLAEIAPFAPQEAVTV